MSDLTANQREKMIADLRLVVADAEELLKMTADEVGESALGLRERLQDRLSQAKHRLLTLQSTVTDGARPPLAVCGHRCRCWRAHRPAHRPPVNPFQPHRYSLP